MVNVHVIKAAKNIEIKTVVLEESGLRDDIGELV